MSSGFASFASNQPPVSASVFGQSAYNPFYSYGSAAPFGFGLGGASVGAGRIKLKRARQRVDAGEPRNTYSNIPGFGAPRAAMALPAASTAGGFSPFGATAPIFGGDAGQPQSQWHSAWLRLQQQALEASAVQQRSEELMECALGDDEAAENGNDESDGCSPCKLSRTDVDADAKTPPLVDESTAPFADEAADDMPTESVESAEAESPVDNGDNSPRSKRKEYQPQKVEQEGSAAEAADDAEDGKLEINTGAAGEPQSRVQELLTMQRQWYVDWLAQHQKKFAAAASKAADDSARHEQSLLCVDNRPNEVHRSQAPMSVPSTSPKDLKSLGQALKTELISSLSTNIDKIISEYVQAETNARLVAQQQLQAAISTAEQHAAPAAAARPFYLNPFYAAAGFPYSGGAPAGFGAFGASAAAAAAAALGNHSIFPGGSFNGGAYGGAPTAAHGKDDGMFGGLGMPRKKRSKVTDTRLSKMPVRGDGGASRGSPMAGYFPPTMVGHPLYGSTFGADEHDADSPVNSDDGSDGGPFDASMPQQSCMLTPMHLRKAKLMFFFTRYPSSTLLKSYFPDIRFNKNNTAQLVKWFSNFREFYYILMEKYAKQEVAQGTVRAEDIFVPLDSELYKHLNQHYNRNNHIQPPPNFREVVESTLREFFVAIQAGKDVEPSWKKQIYKVIARMDDSIPEYFKNPNFLEQLE